MSGYTRPGTEEPVAEETVEAVPEEDVIVGPQALLDEHVYPTPPSTDSRMTHIAMTEAEELAAAETPPAEPPPDTTTGGLGRTN